MSINTKLAQSGLPSREEFENMFGTCDLEESDDIIENMIDHIIDYLDKYSSFLENLLQPDSSLVAMRESSVVDDATRVELYNLFKKIIYHKRLSLKVMLNPKNEYRIEYLKSLISFWKEINFQLEKHVDDVLSVWKQQESEEPSQAYFG
ncbi:MAG: hypothetical protein ACLFTH_03560 [Candidatus Woesearchaeota archaeon]